MKPLKPGDKMRPIVAVQINLAPSINSAAIRLEYLKYVGQKPFISETYTADAGCLEALAAHFLKAAAELRAGTDSSPGSTKH